MNGAAKTITPVAATQFDARGYRQTLGQFATGVTILTTCTADGQRVGLTVNSFTSVSLDPPLVLWCLRREAASVPPFLAAARFAINVLALDQAAVAQRFAERHGDRFAGGDWRAGPGGMPLLGGAVAHLVCRTVARQPAGDHLVFIGEVEHHARFAGDPLAFHGGAYGRLVSLPPEEAVYSGIAPKMKVA
jgi:flavin reductase (DIM6/NTAB) family NADH-FMN oxidoreductase RutF